MNLSELIRKNRSYRRFDASEKISEETLVELIDLARQASAARNGQALKYLLINKKEECDFVFPLLSWAGYLTDWDGPSEEERPTAYIVVLKDSEISSKIHCDHGLAIQNILLGAVDKGYGGCIIGAVKHEAIRSHFEIPEHLEILYILALGKPTETVILEEMKDNDIRYWRDENNIHHVPKRSLEEIIINKKQ